MIRFSDITINDAHCNFLKVRELMGDVPWMLKTDATVVTEDGMRSNFVLHLWQEGRVVIKATDRPSAIGAPDSDLQQLKKWCEINGWEELHIDPILIQDPAGFDFWMQKYRSGFVESELLKRYDEEEMERLSRSLYEEEDEDEGDNYAS